MSKLSLFTDFMDYYDHWFETGAENVLRRHSRDGLDKFGQLYFLEKNGLNVPAFGYVDQLINTPRFVGGAPEARRPKLSKNCKKLVVYTDQKAHCGDGKLLLNLDEASKYPNCLASEYIDSEKGVSWRYLQVGLHGFWLEYRSGNDWRSNAGGEIDIEVIGKEEGWCNVNHFICKLPLFAVDFVVGDKLYAIDFNVAPGIRGSGVERYLSPFHAAESIKKAYFEGTYLEDLPRLVKSQCL